MAHNGTIVQGGNGFADITHATVMETVAASSDLTLVVSAEMIVGEVVASPGLSQVVAGWTGKPLLDLFSRESRRKLETRLAEGAFAAPAALELNHEATTGLDLPVRYTIVRLGGKGGLLLLGRDLRALSEVQQRLVEAQLALQRDHEAQREIETRYRVLLEASEAPILIISAATGRIVDLNRAAVELTGASRADLVDAAVAQEFEGRRRGEFLEALSRAAVADVPAPVELTVRRTRRRVQVSPTLFRAAGDKLLLCRVELADDARAQQDELTVALSRLFQQGVDGVVFIGGDGVIKAANEAFLNLTDVASLSNVVGRSIGDFLVRGEVDLKVLLENVKRIGRLRHYATRLNTDFGGEVAVELSATYVQDKGAGMVGLIIRDATAAEGLRLPGMVPGNEGLKNVMQLVGYSALKEIVAETTEIIEKMCIEAALELTGNNRAAAAELLSLSRQSLYVKLRKFGLLSKSGND